MGANLLEQKAPGLVAQIENLTAHQKRQVVAKVCDTLGDSIRDLEPLILSLLRFAIDNNELSEEQIAALNRYAEAADDRYLDSKESGENEIIWNNWFSKARLATALAQAFSSTALEPGNDAFYELCFAGEDEQAVIALIQSKISSVRI